MAITTAATALSVCRAVEFNTVYVAGMTVQWWRFSPQLPSISIMGNRTEYLIGIRIALKGVGTCLVLQKKYPAPLTSI